MSAKGGTQQDVYLFGHVQTPTDHTMEPLMHNLPQMVAEPTYEGIVPTHISDVSASAHAPSRAWQTTIQPQVPAPDAAINKSHQDSSAKGVKHQSGAPKEACYVELSRRVVGNRMFVASTTLLTVWALVGDDLRIMFTRKPADPIFDIFVIVCMVIFSFEIVVSCVGTEDYFRGFFFGLDVVSTCTLIMDLSLVRDAMSAGGTDADRARSSKTARIGAKLGRVVRVLRIVRIVKLFKAYYLTQAAKVKRQNTLSWDQDSDDEYDVDPHNFRVNITQTQSLVGKKLSTKMTQRTIILVLVLLIGLPVLGPQYDLLMQSSASLGADSIHEAFMRLYQGSGSRSAYEELFLQYLYFHNWFLGRGGQTCPTDTLCAQWYFGQAFWFGFAGTNHSAVREFAEFGRIRRQSVETWEAGSDGRQDYRYFLGSMPWKALEMLWLPWNTECTSGNMLYQGFSLISHEIEGAVDDRVVCPNDLRNTENVQFTPLLQTSTQKRHAGLVFIFDMRPFTQREALLSLLTTVLVCIVLCVASTMFSHDANVLILQPLEEMMSKLAAIKNSPLAAIQLADDEFRREEASRRTKNLSRKSPWSPLLRWRANTQDPKQTLETVILEKTLVKLGTLIALGFGEAGANIVRHNMVGTTSGVNAMIEGLRVNCIIGSACIRDFEVATEVLQGNVMKFVNQIAEIVHGVVDECSGAINRNNGNGFLVVWRVDDMDECSVEKAADLSVYAFARILAAVHSSPTLAEYRLHPGLKLHLTSQCRVNLSVGLHYGWVIEGAVGSEFKIDASYLSPHVSLAESMETATRIYGVYIIASETVVSLCTCELVEQLRLIDKVVVYGSRVPLRLYCLDLDSLNVQVGLLGTRSANFTWNAVARHKARRIHKSKKMTLWYDTTPISHLMLEHEDIVQMRQGYTLEFLQVFNMGYQNYSEGEWAAAQQYLSKTCGYLGFEDGPSVALLQFMERNHFRAPLDWKGVHDLREELDHLVRVYH